MRRPALLVLLVLLTPGASTAWSKEKSATPAPVSPKERDRAIEQGLRYLDKTVMRLPDVEGTPRKPFTIGVNGLVHLLATGGKSSSAGSGSGLRKARTFLSRYVGQVAKQVEDKTRLPDHAGQFRSDRLIQYTWPVAMAGMFFGELHARGKHTSEARAVLKKVRSILRKAQRDNGGWGHHQTRSDGAQRPTAKGVGGYPETLLCCSFVVGSTLGLLEGTGAKVLPSHLQDAVAYFGTAQLTNGNFPYDPSQRSAHRSMTGVSRSAGAAFAMWTLGVPWRDKSMQRSLDFIDEHFDYLNEGHGSSTLNLMYGALLQRARGAKAWKRFKARYFRPIVDGQSEDGSFACVCENKAFGATNDSDPFGAKTKGPGKRVVKRAGNMDAGKAFRKNGDGAYISAIHTFILLLDRSNLNLLDGKRPKIPSAARKPVTTR